MLLCISGPCALGYGHVGWLSMCLTLVRLGFRTCAVDGTATKIANFSIDEAKGSRLTRSWLFRRVGVSYQRNYVFRTEVVFVFEMDGRI